MRELHTGDALAGYRIDGVAGRGGMGVVYRATHMRLRRVDALKVIAPELADEVQFRNRFERESQVAAQIDHPNVIPIYAAGEQDGLLYIAMRFVEGTDLRAVLRQEGRIEAKRAAQIVAAVASALDAAHECGLVHRDVKPANVLLAHQRDHEHVYLSDFGLAKVVTSPEGETRTGMFVGTTDYVSPEQVLAERLDARSDVYSLGCTLFHMLTGQVPYPTDVDSAKLVAHTRDPVPSVLSIAPDLPSEFEGVVARAMAKAPDERYLSAGDLGRAAVAACAGRSLRDGQRSVAKGEAAPTETTLASPTRTSEEPDATILASASPEVQTERTRAPTTVTMDETKGTGAEATKTAAPPHRRVNRRLALLGTVAAIVVAAIVVVAIAVGGGSSTRAGAGITVGNSPDGIAIGQGSVWIANAGDATVTRIDEKSAKVLGTLSYANRSEPAAAITLFGSTLWVADSNAGVVKRFDAINGNPFGTPINVGGRPAGITFASGYIWVTSSDNDTVTRIDGGSQSPVGRPIPVGRSPERIGGGLNSVWAANSGEGTITRIDASTGQVIATITVGGHPVATSIANGDLWVVNDTNNSVTRFDALSGAPNGGPIPVGTSPKRITAGTDSLWVTNSGDGTVSRISATTGQVLARIPVGGHPDVITVRRGLVWVGTWSQATAHYRGAPGTVVRINERTGKLLGT